MSIGHPPFETEGAVARRDALDVSQLPSYGYSHRSLMWWGTLGIMAVEGVVFALAVMAYFYIRSQAREWPPGVAPPDLLWGTVNTFILLASGIPNQLAWRAAERRDAGAVRLWLMVCVVFSIAFIAVRFLEYSVLNVRWDTNAYGSIVWILLSLHFTHLLTDLFDSSVLTALFFTDRIEGKRFVDVSENAMYWWFVIACWIPIYLTIYWVPQG